MTSPDPDDVECPLPVALVLAVCAAGVVLLGYLLAELITR